jgi:large subunit ribosomal protein L10
VIHQDKIDIGISLTETFGSSPHAVLTSFSGLQANQANALRRKIDEAGGSFRVIKNRVAKRAAAGTPYEKLSEMFSGPCAIATHESDPVILAKTISEFVKEDPSITMLGGIIDAGQVLDTAGLKELSSLPGLPELQATLLALIQTPATTLVRLISTPGTQIARVIDAHCQAQEG